MGGWTDEQKQAIDIQGKSLLVSAAAGSGKTAVLVERIIQQISREENPLSLDRMLIVTFTSAAASEMKERIGAALQEKMWENPTSTHLYLQSQMLKDAAITTLHSFCLDFVRRNFFSIGMDPEMKIADTTEGVLLFGEAMENVLEAHYSAENNESFIAFVDRYGGGEDENLREMLVHVFRMAETMPDPEQWVRGLAAENEIDWFGLAAPEIRQKLLQARRNITKAIRLADSDDGLQVYMDTLENEYNRISELAAMELDDNWETVGAILGSGEIFKRMPSPKKNSYDEDVKKLVTAYRQKAKDGLKKLYGDYFTRSREEQLQELAAQHSDRVMLAELTLELMREFDEMKARRNLMDFSDMEHFCYRLLYERDENGNPVLTELALQTRECYDQVMVDEYQDINNLQEAILQAVSRENNLFMVGDLKQSIYGFRMANPQLFNRKYQSYEKPDDNHQRIDLNRNFRCREGVIDGVNNLFAQLMDGRDDNLLYDDNAALVYGAGYPEFGGDRNLPSEKIKLLILRTDSTAEENVEENEAGDFADDTVLTEAEEATDAEKEAKLVAEQLIQLMKNGTPVYDKNSKNYREMNWRDCVVLLRSPKNTGRVYADILNAAGIPAALDAGDGYFGAWEIQVMIAVLQVVDNPIQDIPLLTVMKAPFFDFSEEELVMLRKMQPKESFWFCLKYAVETELSEESDEEQLALQQKTQAFMDTLSRWNVYSRQMRLSDFIWTIMGETGFYEFAGALRDGIQRQANLRALHERARAYEETSYRGVFAFLQFLNQMQQRNEDLEPARVLSDSENVVRIMSIHKSKGLEFPVVFVGGMHRHFNMKEANDGFILDEKLGLALPFTDTNLQIRYNTIAQKVLSGIKMRRMQQEEQRVLYVAMTRAREYLWQIGSCKDPEKIADKDPASGTSYLEWVLSAKKNPSLWEITVVDGDNVTTETGKAKEDNLLRRAAIAGTAAVSDGNWRVQLGEQLNWQYPNPEYHYVKGLYSVSELKKKAAEMQCVESLDKADETKESRWQYRFDRRPVAVQKRQELTGAEKGTLVHEILRHVNPDGEISELSVRSQIDEMVNRKILTMEQAQQADVDAVLAFFNSELGQRFCGTDAADRYRELPFMMQIDSHETDPSLPENQMPVLVQGIIDCMWKEPDGWVLVDYKSDRLRPETAQSELQARYGKQLELYSRAIETILQEPVKEAWFYLLSQKRAIPLIK